MSNVKPIDLAERLVPWSDTRQLGMFNGKRLMRLRLTANEHCETQTDGVEFFHVIRGTLLLVMPEATQTLSDGQMYVVPAGTPCEAMAECDTDLLMIDHQAGPVQFH